MTGVCGIIMAGGSGSRLSPATNVVNKHLLCLYDKPVIYYPLSTLMLAGIRDICILCGPQDIQDFKTLLGDGGDFGLNLSYIAQDKPSGIAEGYILASNFINGRRSILMLGDNILFGDRLGMKIMNCIQDSINNFVFGYAVNDPRPFGVITHNDKYDVIEIQEKPREPKSNLAAVGLYVLNAEASSLVKDLCPSERGELEISDLCNLVAEKYNLKVGVLGRGYSWLDTGTPKDFYAATNFVSTIQERQGYILGCLEEIAFRNGWLSSEAIQKIKNRKEMSFYNNYLKRIME